MSKASEIGECVASWRIIRISRSPHLFGWIFLVRYWIFLQECIECRADGEFAEDSERNRGDGSVVGLGLRPDRDSDSTSFDQKPLPNN